MKKYLTWSRVWFVSMVILFALVIYQSTLPFEPKDDSDSPTGSSGMLVLTDHLTGCQYLYRGSLVPRWTRDGEQICK